MSTREKLAKVFFDLSGTSSATGAESLWAEHIKENLFRIDNIPLCVYEEDKGRG